jgi:hypothetical protein
LPLPAHDPHSAVAVAPVPDQTAVVASLRPAPTDEASGAADSTWSVLHLASPLIGRPDAELTPTN